MDKSGTTVNQEFLNPSFIGTWGQIGNVLKTFALFRVTVKCSSTGLNAGTQRWGLSHHEYNNKFTRLYIGAVVDLA